MLQSRPHPVRAVEGSAASAHCLHTFKGFRNAFSVRSSAGIEGNATQVLEEGEDGESGERQALYDVVPKLGGFAKSKAVPGEAPCWLSTGFGPIARVKDQ